MNAKRLSYSLILFFINPIFAVYAAIRNFNFKESRFILILFFGIFGLTMIFTEGKDGYRHAENLKYNYADKDFKTFLDESKNILLLRPGENAGRTNDDIYLHIVSYVAAKWTTSSSGLYLIVSLVYGFFFISSIYLVFTTIKSNWNIILGLLFFVFIFWKSFEGINSIRNWTAAWIYFYGAFLYFKTRKIKYIWFVVIAPLIHFSYVIFTVPFYVVLIFGNRPKIYITILIFSFFMSIADTTFIYDILAISDLGMQKERSYVREGAVDSYLMDRGAGSFHANFYLMAGKIFVSVLFYYALLTLGYITKSKHSYLTLSLASMALLSISISNVFTNIFAVYSRMFNNAGLYILTYLVLMYSYYISNNVKNKRMFGFNTLAIVTSPFALLFVFTQWSQIGEFTDVRVFNSPLIYPFLGDEAMSLKEVLRSLFGL